MEYSYFITNGSDPVIAQQAFIRINIDLSFFINYFLRNPIPSSCICGLPDYHFTKSFGCKEISRKYRHQLYIIIQLRYVLGLWFCSSALKLLLWPGNVQIFIFLLFAVAPRPEISSLSEYSSPRSEAWKPSYQCKLWP